MVMSNDSMARTTVGITRALHALVADAHLAGSAIGIARALHAPTTDARLAGVAVGVLNASTDGQRDAVSGTRLAELARIAVGIARAIHTIVLVTTRAFLHAFLLETQLIALAVAVFLTYIGYRAVLFVTRKEGPRREGSA